MKKAVGKFPDYKHNFRVMPGHFRKSSGDHIVTLRFVGSGNWFAIDLHLLCIGRTMLRRTPGNLHRTWFGLRGGITYASKPSFLSKAQSLGDAISTSLTVPQLRQPRRVARIIRIPPENIAVGRKQPVGDIVVMPLEILRRAD